MAHRNTRPRARKDDLIIEQVGDETLVYDLRNDRAHCLNPSAALVWELADGQTDTEAITEEVREKFGPETDPIIIDYALTRLGRAHLLEAQAGAARSGLTRRDVVRRLGRAAAISLPLVTSILAPTAARAQSTIPDATCGQADTVGKCCAGTGKKCRNRGKSGFDCNGNAC